MNDDWKNWTKVNLDRGCAADEINSILLSNKFSAKQIKAIMGNKYPAGRKSLSNRFLSLIGPRNIGNKDLADNNISNKYPASSADYNAWTRIKIVNDPQAVRFDTELLQLYTIDNFLTPAQCKTLIKQIDANLRPSTITSGIDYHQFRTSSTCDLGLVKHLQVSKIDQKIAQTLGVQISWSETMQGQKYDVSQEFKEHTDYFEPQTKEFELFAGKMGQRTWTFMVYLNTTLKGGETHFTEIDKAFLPKQGSALIWNNLLADGSPNPFTMHHGCPVHEGTKYIVTKWFRDKGEGQPFFA